MVTVKSGIFIRVGFGLTSKQLFAHESDWMIGG